MAGQATNPVPAMTVQHPSEKPVVDLVVIEPHFQTQYPVDLTIANDGRVTDVNGRLIFSVKSKSMSLHSRRYLENAAGNILVTLEKKIFTLHGRRQVFNGKSKNQKDLLFTVKESSGAKKTHLDVFLASNRTSETVPDFKVKGSTIYYLRDGEPEVIIAKMVTDTDNFTVKVYPNVDYAFVVALVVAVAAVVGDKSHDGRSGQVMRVAKVVTWVGVLVKWVVDWGGDSLGG